MPYLARAEYTSNGNDTRFMVPFPYIHTNHIFAYDLGDTDDAPQVVEIARWNGPTEIQLAEPIPAGHVLRIVRETPEEQMLVEYTDASFPTEYQLNRANTQLLFITQELEDRMALVDADALAGRMSTIEGELAAVSDYATQALSAAYSHSPRHAAGGPDAVSPASIGAVEEAPADGKQYARQDGAWAEVAGFPDGGAPGDILGLDASDEPAWLKPAQVAASLPFASASQAGVVKPDNVTTFVINGILTAVGGGGGNVVVTSTDNIIDPNVDETQTVVNTGFRGRLSALEGNQTSFITAAQAGNMVAAVVEPLSEKVGEVEADIVDLANAVAAKVDDAPHDGNVYGRSDGAWVETGGSDGIPDAPADGIAYGRKDGDWAEVISTSPEDLAMLSGLGMPSERYVDFTLPESGGTYTAPANGYVFVTKQATAVGQGIGLGLGGVGEQFPRVSTAAATSSNTLSTCLAVRKGQIVGITNSLGGATRLCRFVYAEGN